MRIKVEIFVDLPDPDQWTTTFGVQGRDKIRKDVKVYIGNGVQHAGVFGSGEVDAEITWN